MRGSSEFRTASAKPVAGRAMHTIGQVEGAVWPSEHIRHGRGSRVAALERWIRG